MAELRAKFGDERRTHIETVTGEVDVEDLIPKEDCVYTLTHCGYMKRQPVEVYHTQNRGGKGVSGMTQKEEDFTEEVFVGNTHEYIMLFTSAGKVYRIKGYEIPSGSRVSKGTNVVNILPITGEEKVTAMIRVPAFEEGQYLVMVTQNGVIKRCRLTDFDTARKSGVIAIDLDEGDHLSWVKLTNGHDQLIVATKNGLASRFDEQEVRCMGRTARGVRAIKLEEGDQVVGLARVQEDGMLLTVTEKGKGRRTSVSEYRKCHRGTQGVINYKVEEETGYVAGVRIVTDQDDVIAISDDGIIIRFAASDVSVQSRYAGGVWVMRPAEGSRVVSIAVTPKEEDQKFETDGEEETNP